MYRTLNILFRRPLSVLKTGTDLASWNKLYIRSMIAVICQNYPDFLESSYECFMTIMPLRTFMRFMATARLRLVSIPLRF